MYLPMRLYNQLVSSDMTNLLAPAPSSLRHKHKQSTRIGRPITLSWSNLHLSIQRKQFSILEWTLSTHNCAKFPPRSMNFNMQYCTWIQGLLLNFSANLVLIPAASDFDVVVSDTTLHQGTCWFFHWSKMEHTNQSEARKWQWDYRRCATHSSMKTLLGDCCSLDHEENLRHRIQQYGVISKIRAPMNTKRKRTSISGIFIVQDRLGLSRKSKLPWAT
jgi:hypothetical protein